MSSNSLLHLLLGYMNLPRSAVTPRERSTPKTSSNVNTEEPSDYMNIEPKDIHIYQNTSVLNLTKNSGAAGTAAEGVIPGLVLDELHTINRTQESPTQGNSNNNSSSVTEPGPAESLHTDPDSTQSPAQNPHKTHNNSMSKGGSRAKSKSTNSSLVEPSSSKSSSERNSHHVIKREAMADRSFVERKYGLPGEDMTGGYQVRAK